MTAHLYLTAAFAPQSLANIDLLLCCLAAHSSFVKHKTRKVEKKKGEGAIPSMYDDDDFGEIRTMISR